MDCFNIVKGDGLLLRLGVKRIAEDALEEVGVLVKNVLMDGKLLAFGEEEDLTGRRADGKGPVKGASEFEAMIQPVRITYLTRKVHASAQSIWSPYRTRTMGFGFDVGRERGRCLSLLAGGALHGWRSPLAVRGFCVLIVCERVGSNSKSESR